MKRMLIAGALALAAGGQAFAADLPVPAPPPPRAPATYVPVAPVFTWTGIYIGVNGGYSFGTTEPLGAGAGPNFSTNGIVAGGTIGGNYQVGAFVFGVEGDFDWDNIKGNIPGCVGCEIKSTWLATARGRVGVAFDRVLVYGTGGAAFQNIQLSLPTIASGTINPFGWTAGGGVEFAISPNWSVKAEYLFVDFHNENITLGTPPTTVNFNLIENVVRGGVNYRF